MTKDELIRQLKKLGKRTQKLTNETAIFERLFYLLEYVNDKEIRQLIINLK